MEFAGKQIAVLGLARSGESVARLLASRGALVSVFDTGESEALQARANRLRESGMKAFTGPDFNITKTFDLAVISPGIDQATPFVRQFVDQGIPLSGELEIAFRYCQKPVIAITGTNGKTTTTELISAMLNAAGMPTIACGNIGLPFSEVVAQMQDSLDIITLEVSSFQLETIATFRPHIALWLNFTPDHLDRYPNLQAYRAAKSRIFDHQQSTDFAVCNASEHLPGIVSRKITFSAYHHPADFTLIGDSIHFRKKPVAALGSFQLLGSHNAENLMAALAVGISLDLTFEEILPPLQAYRPAPHRCELVAEIDGVRYINDSKATNVDALAKALTTVAGKVILIAGGKDKGFEFSSLREFLPGKVKQVVLIGEMAERIDLVWHDIVPCSRAVTLQDAVSHAHAIAQPGDTVLFSPGTSSFDMFRDYADRGEQFRKATANLQLSIPNLI